MLVLEFSSLLILCTQWSDTGRGSLTSRGSDWLWPWEWQITAPLVQSQRGVHMPRNTRSLAICRKSPGALSFDLCAVHTHTHLVLLSLPLWVLCTSVLSPVWAALTGCLPSHPSPPSLYMLRDPKALTVCCWFQLIYFTVTLFLEHSFLLWSFEEVFREAERTLFSGSPSSTWGFVFIFWLWWQWSPGPCRC